MKVISFANVKGGSGKTTSAALLLSGLVEKGYRVGVIDCDPLYPLSDWCSKVRGSKVRSFKVDKTADLHEVIDMLRAEADFVIIDLSGASDVMNALSFAFSDLVLVPMQGSAIDARGAAHTVNLLKIVADNRRAPIETAMLLTRINPVVVTHAVRYAMEVVASLGVSFLKVPVFERSAYRDMFSLMATLFDGNTAAISNLDKALRDIRTLTDAVVGRVSALPSQGLRLPPKIRTQSISH